jgi:uncharacterized protein (DUF302 family)
MSYYINRVVELPFEKALDRVVAELKNEGFGVLTEIDVRATLKKKLDVDFRKYRILGACNPPFAYEALRAEDKIGVMLPCNVIVQELEDGSVEVAAMDPIGAMGAIDNPRLRDIAEQVRDGLLKVVNSI